MGLLKPLDLFSLLYHTPSMLMHSHLTFPLFSLPPSLLSPPITPSSLQPHPCSLTLTQWTGALLLADGFLQAANDAVLVPETLAVGGSEGLHLTAVLDSVSL